MRKVLVGGVVCLLGVINAHGEAANVPSHRVTFGGLHGALRWSQAPFDMKNPVDEATGSLRGFGGGVQFGYGWSRNNIYVGGEIS